MLSSMMVVLVCTPTSSEEGRDSLHHILVSILLLYLLEIAIVTGVKVPE